MCKLWFESSQVNVKLFLMKLSCYLKEIIIAYLSDNPESGSLTHIMSHKMETKTSEINHFKQTLLKN